MNAFHQAQRVEARAMVDLLPFLRLHAYDGRYVTTDKGSLSKMLQKTAGDVLLNHKDDQKLWAIEIKAEKSNKYGNFFLETWSNLSRFTQGWMHTLSTDLLFYYYFVEEKDLYIIKFQSLREWAFQGRNIYTFPERKQSEYEQLNDTWGRCVPIPIIGKKVGFKRVSLASASTEPTLATEADSQVALVFAESLFASVEGK